MLKNEPFFGGRLFDHEFSPFLGRSFTAKKFRVRYAEFWVDYLAAVFSATSWAEISAVLTGPTFRPSIGSWLFSREIRYRSEREPTYPDLSQASSKFSNQLSMKWDDFSADCTERNFQLSE